MAVDASGDSYEMPDCFVFVFILQRPAGCQVLVKKVYFGVRKKKHLTHRAAVRSEKGAEWQKHTAGCGDSRQVLMIH